MCGLHSTLLHCKPAACCNPVLHQLNVLANKLRVMVQHRMQITAGVLQFLVLLYCT